MHLPTIENYLDPKETMKAVLIESRTNPITRGVYLNPSFGDLAQDLI